MNRTRLIFYLFLGVYLAAITAALALNIAGERFIMQLFVASAVFSLGVVMLDFLGILGGQHDGAAGGDTAGHIAADASGHDFGGHDGGGAPDGAPHAAGEADGHADDGGAHNAQPHATGGQHNAAPILSALTYLRLFVYFCLGFGPAGLISRLTGQSVFLSLGVAALAGLIALILAQAFFRFQRSDLDSQLGGADLVGQRATVIVPLDHHTMGKVRVRVGPVVTEQYALAARADAAFAAGDEVVVSAVTEECVLVH